VATFFNDGDLTGTGETVESEVWLATELTVPDGEINFFRWRWPAVAPVVTPVFRLFNAAGTEMEIGPASATTLAFDTSANDAWNSATPPSPIVLAAGTYRPTINTTRYVFKGSFFSGGSIVRGDITGVQGRFGPPGSAPASTSPTAYLPEFDFTADAGSTPISVGDTGAAADGIGVTATAALADTAAAGEVLALAVTLGLTESASVAEALAVAAAVGLADTAAAVEALAVVATVSLSDLAAAVELFDNGANIPKSLADAASAVERLRITTVRPNTGTTTRPFTGVTLRP